MCKVKLIYALYLANRIKPYKIPLFTCCYSNLNNNGDYTKERRFKFLNVSVLLVAGFYFVPANLI
jgi:hypothetical protein